MWFATVYLGDYYDNVLEYWRARDQKNMLILKYEDMKKVSSLL